MFENIMHLIEVSYWWLIGINYKSISKINYLMINFCLDIKMFNLVLRSQQFKNANYSLLENLGVFGLCVRSLIPKKLVSDKGKLYNLSKCIILNGQKGFSPHDSCKTNELYASE